MSSPKLWINKLNHLFGFDKRSLALFRVCLGLLAMGNIIDRLENLEYHLSDSGVMRRSEILLHNKPGVLLIHALNGSYAFQVFLYLVHIVIGFLLTIGWKTKWMALLQWFFLVSLVRYGYFLNSAGDLLFCIVSILSFFLPMNKVWSVDSLLKRRKSTTSQTNTPQDPSKQRFFGPASVLYLCLVLSLYSSSTYYKTGDAWTKTYTAIQYSLKVSSLSKPAAELFIKYTPPIVLQIMTWCVVKLELFAPFFYFMPVFTDAFRMIGIIGLVSLHLGFFVFFNLGLFIHIGVIIHLVFIPSSFWTFLFSSLSTQERRNTVIIYNSRHSFSKWLGRSLSHFLVLPCTTVVNQASKEELGEIIEEGSFDEQPSSVISVYIKTSHTYMHNTDALVYLFRHIIPFTWILGLLLMKFPRINNPIDRVLSKLHNDRSLKAKKTKKRIPTSKERTLLERIYKILINCFIVFIIISYVWYTLHSINKTSIAIPSASSHALSLMGMKYRWSMFSPEPAKRTNFQLVFGQLSSGEKVEFMSTRSIALKTWEPSFDEFDMNSITIEDHQTAYPTYRWRKFFESLGKQDVMKRRLVDFVCTTYNKKLKERSDTRKLESVELAILTYVTNNVTFEHNPPQFKSLHKAKCKI